MLYQIRPVSKIQLDSEIRFVIKHLANSGDPFWFKELADSDIRPSLEIRPILEFIPILETLSIMKIYPGARFIRISSDYYQYILIFIFYLTGFSPTYFDFIGLC